MHPKLRPVQLQPWMQGHFLVNAEEMVISAASIPVSKHGEVFRQIEWGFEEYSVFIVEVERAGLGTWHA